MHYLEDYGRVEARECGDPQTDISIIKKKANTLSRILKNMIVLKQCVVTATLTFTQVAPRCRRVKIDEWHFRIDTSKADYRCILWLNIDR